MIRVLLADDQALVRSSFPMILDSRDDVDAVGEAEDSLAAVALAAELTPDVILMDVRMPKLEGVEATRRIVATRADARILILTTFDLDEYVNEAIRAGASGFLLEGRATGRARRRDPGHAAGNALLGTTVAKRLLDRFTDWAPRATPPTLEGLTEGEREILALLAGGLSNAEIAKRLVVGETTVKTLSRGSCASSVFAIACRP